MTVFAKLEDQDDNGHVQFGHGVDADLVEVAFLGEDGQLDGEVRVIDLDDLVDAVERLAGRRIILAD